MEYLIDEFIFCVAICKEKKGMIIKQQTLKMCLPLSLCFHLSKPFGFASLSISSGYCSYTLPTFRPSLLSIHRSLVLTHQNEIIQIEHPSRTHMISIMLWNFPSNQHLSSFFAWPTLPFSIPFNNTNFLTCLKVFFKRDGIFLRVGEVVL